VAWRVLRAESVVTTDGPVVLTRRCREVLLLLLLQPNEQIPTDRLVDRLWGERPPSTAHNSIARFVADLRRALGRHRGRIVTGHGGYRIEVHDGELDWDVARAALTEARLAAGTDDDRCAEAIARAMAAAGTEPNPWLLDLPGAATAARLHEEHRLEMLQVLVDLQHRRGRARELVDVLERAVHLHPFNEGLWAHLMVALERSGRPAEALRAYQRMRARLADIGLVPGDHTTRLDAEIVAGLGPRAPEASNTRPSTAREQMLATTVEWSWARLSQSQQLLLARLSVFQGGWTAEAAEAVCRGREPTVAALDDLVDRFLLTRSPDGRRYDMPDAVRQRAAACLAVTPDDVRARRERVVDWVRQSTEPWAVADLHACDEPNAALMAESGNLEVALAHLRTTRRHEALVWLAVRYFGMLLACAMPDVAIEWLEPTTSSSGISTEARSAAAAVLMHSYRAVGDDQRAACSGLASLELAEGRSHDWLTSVAGVLSVSGLEQSLPYSVEELQAISLHHATNSPSTATNLATDSLHRGQVDLARHDYESAIGHFRAAQHHNPRLGPLRRQSEIGEALTLCHAGRHAEALTAVNRWTPKPGHDHLHPSREAILAIVLAHAGNLDHAKTALAKAVLRTTTARVDGARDLELAFTMLNTLPPRTDGDPDRRSRDQSATDHG